MEGTSNMKTLKTYARPLYKNAQENYERVKTRAGKNKGLVAKPKLAFPSVIIPGVDKADVNVPQEYFNKVANAREQFKNPA